MTPTAAGQQAGGGDPSNDVFVTPLPPRRQTSDQVESRLPEIDRRRFSKGTSAVVRQQKSAVAAADRPRYKRKQDTLQKLFEIAGTSGQVDGAGRPPHPFPNEDDFE